MDVESWKARGQNFCAEERATPIEEASASAQTTQWLYFVFFGNSNRIELRMRPSSLNHNRCNIHGCRTVGQLHDHMSCSRPKLFALQGEHKSRVCRRSPLLWKLRLMLQHTLWGSLNHSSYPRWGLERAHRRSVQVLPRTNMKLLSWLSRANEKMGQSRRPAHQANSPNANVPSH